MSQYTVYTKPACSQCDKTKDYFDARDITYTTVDVTEDAEAYDYITVVLGFRQMPVVVNTSDPEDRWSGLRRDKLVQASMNHTAAPAGAR